MAITLLQITDLHLFEKTEARLDFGDGIHPLDTAVTLKRVLNNVRNNPVCNEATLCLVTGDLVQDTTIKTYERLPALLSTLSLPCYCLPGNHDKPEWMRTYLHQDDGFLRVDDLIELPYWNVILLDTSFPMSPAGWLSEAQLERLEELLLFSEGKNVLIAMHHHPIPIGSRWMDVINLQKPEPFLLLLAKFSHIRAVLFGHIHQEFDEEKDGIRFLGTPSTCVQFVEKQDKMIFSDKTPAYRTIILNDDGSIDTTVQYT